MTIKTAISIDDVLFEKVDELASELNLSRSRLYRPCLFYRHSAGAVRSTRSIHCDSAPIPNRLEDHVHMILSIPPKYAVSEMMGFLNGKLAKRMFDRFPNLRKRYWGQHVWS